MTTKKEKLIHYYKDLTIYETIKELIEKEELVHQKIKLGLSHKDCNLRGHKHKRNITRKILAEKLNKWMEGESKEEILSYGNIIDIEERKKMQDTEQIKE